MVTTKKVKTAKMAVTVKKVGTVKKMGTVEKMGTVKKVMAVKKLGTVKKVGEEGRCIVSISVWEVCPIIAHSHNGGFVTFTSREVVA